MIDLVIREALEADLPAVLNLYVAAGIGENQIFSPLEASSQLARFRRYPSLRVFIAVLGHCVVGTYELLIMDNLAKRGKHSGIVEDVAVHPNHQGRGIGRAMMQHALDQCREAGCYKLTLSSNLNREDAHGFYNAVGFKRHGYSFQIEVTPEK